MAGLVVSHDLSVVLRRFATDTLSGSDLAQIRDAVLGMSQEQAGERWGIRRNQVSKCENAPEPDVRTCDAYVGMMIRVLLSGAGKF